MELYRFLNEFFVNNNGKISDKFKDWPLEEWQYFAELTSEIDFGCEFIFNNGCKNHRGKNNRCCCIRCGQTAGYLRHLPNNLNDIKFIASLFNNRLGFWRKGKGCILPRKYRSSICLVSYCTFLTYPKSPKELLILAILNSSYEIYRSEYKNKFEELIDLE